MSSLEEKIDNLDLKRVKEKFIKEQSWWNKLWVKADDVEKEYRRFLILCGQKEEKISPWCQEVDDFWHTHILFTRQYAQDCQNLYGYMMHHEPTPTELLREQKVNDVTHALYTTLFGQTTKKFGLVACFGGSCSGCRWLKATAGCDACSSGGGCTSCCSGGGK